VAYIPIFKRLPSYTNVIKLLKDFNFSCSIQGDIATKKDIAKFTELPISTINYYLKNHTDLNLILECNGYDNHSSYDKIAEAEREQFITKNYSLVRFHHKIDWKTLVNGILRTKIGQITTLYNVGKFNKSQISMNII